MEGSGLRFLVEYTQGGGLSPVELGWEIFERGDGVEDVQKILKRGEGVGRIRRFHPPHISRQERSTQICKASPPGQTG